MYQAVNVNFFGLASSNEAILIIAHEIMKFYFFSDIKNWIKYLHFSSLKLFKIGLKEKM